MKHHSFVVPHSLRWSHAMLRVLPWLILPVAAEEACRARVAHCIVGHVRTFWQETVYQSIADVLVPRASPPHCADFFYVFEFIFQFGYLKRRPLRIQRDLAMVNCLEDLTTNEVFIWSTWTQSEAFFLSSTRLFVPMCPHVWQSSSLYGLGTEAWKRKWKDISMDFTKQTWSTVARWNSTSTLTWACRYTYLHAYHKRAHERYGVQRSSANSPTKPCRCFFWQHHGQVPPSSRYGGRSLELWSVDTTFLWIQRHSIHTFKATWWDSIYSFFVFFVVFSLFSVFLLWPCVCSFPWFETYFFATIQGWRLSLSDCQISRMIFLITMTNGFNTSSLHSNYFQIQFTSWGMRMRSW